MICKGRFFLNGTKRNVRVQIVDSMDSKQTLSKLLFFTHMV